MSSSSSSSACRKCTHPKTQRMSCLWITSLVVWVAALMCTWYIVYQVWMANEMYQQARHEQQRRLIEYAITVFQSSCPAKSEEAFRNAGQWVDDCQQINFADTLKFKLGHIEQDAVLLALGGIGMERTCNYGWLSLSSVPCWSYALLMHRGDVFPAAVLIATTLLFGLLYLLTVHQFHRAWVNQWEKKIQGDRKRDADYDLNSSVRQEGEIDVQVAASRTSSRHPWVKGGNGTI